MFYRMSYQVVMTVASFEIARCIRKDAYALIFGINFWSERQTNFPAPFS